MPPTHLAREVDTTSSRSGNEGIPHSLLVVSIILTLELAWVIALGLALRWHEKIKTDKILKALQSIQEWSGNFYSFLLNEVKTLRENLMIYVTYIETNIRGTGKLPTGGQNQPSTAGPQTTPSPFTLEHASSAPRYDHLTSVASPRHHVQDDRHIHFVDSQRVSDDTELEITSENIEPPPITKLSSSSSSCSSSSSSWPEALEKNRKSIYDLFPKPPTSLSAPKVTVAVTAPPQENPGSSDGEQQSTGGEVPTSPVTSVFERGRTAVQSPLCSPRLPPVSLGEELEAVMADGRDEGLEGE